MDTEKKQERTQQIFTELPKNKRKSDFFSNFSHEIRTPMNTIIGMTTIAEASLDQPERLRNCLTKISTASKSLLMLINDILDMEKMESGSLELSEEPFRLKEITDNVCSLTYLQAEEKAQNFEVAVDVVQEELLGDEVRISQILLNLLSNAVKYTPQGGTIKLRIEEQKEENSPEVFLRFVVSDNGIGMKQDFLTRIFLPFEQEKQIPGGTGLGLAITKKLVTVLGGTIRVQSRLGEGSRFIVEIPVKPDPKKVHMENAMELKGLKVLIAAGDRETSECTRKRLFRMGMEAEWAADINTVLRKIQDRRRQNNMYDAVLIDYKLPGGEGAGAPRRIRQEEGAESLKLVFCTFDCKKYEKEAKMAGADAVVKKPVYSTAVFEVLKCVTNGGTMKDGEALFAAMGDKRFLVAEDNEVNAEIAVELLKMMGAKVDTVRNGKEAFQTFACSQMGYYDMILMDVRMPVMDGYEATKAIRISGHPQAKTIPVLAMTADTYSRDISKALDSGMNAHIAKPVNFEKLCQLVDEELEKAKQKGASKTERP